MKPIPHSVNLEFAGLFKHPLSTQLISCHLQLNRGAVHLETAFAVKSRSKVLVLQLSRGAIASHFCHWTRPFVPHVGAYWQATSALFGHIPQIAESERSGVTLSNMHALIRSFFRTWAALLAS